MHEILTHEGEEDGCTPRSKHKLKGKSLIGG